MEARQNTSQKNRRAKESAPKRQENLLLYMLRERLDTMQKAITYRSYRQTSDFMEQGVCLPLLTTFALPWSCSHSSLNFHDPISCLINNPGHSEKSSLLLWLESADMKNIVNFLEGPKKRREPRRVRWSDSSAMRRPPSLLTYRMKGVTTLENMNLSYACKHILAADWACLAHDVLWIQNKRHITSLQINKQCWGCFL